MSDVRGELLQQIKDKAVVHGKVTLSSGLEADYYVDLRRITLSAQAVPLVGRVLLDLTADWDFDAVGGLTMGADPVATAMLHAAAAQGRRLDAFVVRKQAKAHGLQRRVLYRDRIIEDDHHTVSCVTLKCAAVLDDARTDCLMVLTQERHHIFGVRTF